MNSITTRAYIRLVVLMLEWQALEDLIGVQPLRHGKIAAAALDVFETEPLPIDCHLRQINNCLLAPHNSNSGLTADASYRSGIGFKN